MWDGEICFSINGKSCGVASDDKKLKAGKYYISVILGSVDDQITLINPRKITQASNGYELLFSKLNILPFEDDDTLIDQEALESRKFQDLFEKLQEYFTEPNQQKDFHRMIIGSYLNDANSFDSLCNHLKGGQGKKKNPITSIGMTRNKSSLSKQQILDQIIQSYMSPPLTSYSDFHDSDIRGPFEQFHSILICDLLNLHFQLKAALDMNATKDQETKPDEEQKNDGKPEDNAELKASEPDNKEKKL